MQASKPIKLYNDTDMNVYTSPSLCPYTYHGSSEIEFSEDFIRVCLDFHLGSRWEDRFGMFSDIEVSDPRNKSKAVIFAHLMALTDDDCDDEIVSNVLVPLFRFRSGRLYLLSTSDQLSAARDLICSWIRSRSLS